MTRSCLGENTGTILMEAALKMISQCPAPEK